MTIQFPENPSKTDVSFTHSDLTSTASELDESQDSRATPSHPGLSALIASIEQRALQQREFRLKWLRSIYDDPSLSDEDLFQRDDEFVESGAEVIREYADEYDAERLRCQRAEQEWFASAVEKVKLLRVDEESGMVAVPNEVLLGAREHPERLPETDPSVNLIEEYLRIVKPLTEAPTVYHLATLLTVVGTAAGRRSFYIEKGKPKYLNLWTLLLGASADRKSTAAGFGRDLFRDVAKWLDDRNLVFQDTFGTVLGLLDNMQHGPVLLGADEIMVLLERMRKSGDSVGLLNSAYECPTQLEHRTRTQVTIAQDPMLSVIGCGVLNSAADLFSSGESVNGFMNRWSLFAGRRQSEPIPVSPPLDQQRWNGFARALAEVLHLAEGEMGLDSGANALFTEFYRVVYSMDDPNNSIARTPAMARKYACIFAILERTKTVTLKTMEAGILLSIYNASCAAKVLGNSGSKGFLLQEHLLRILKASGGEVGFRDAYTKLRLSAGELGKLVDGLNKRGLVITQTICVRGQKKDVIQLPVSDPGC